MEFKHKFKRYGFAALFVVAASTSYANPNTSQAVSTNATTFENNNQWQIMIAPYVWAVNMDGSSQIGTIQSDVSESFGDILSQLQWGGMLFLDAHYNELGLFLNTLYASLKETSSSNITLKTDFGLFSWGASYAAFQRSLNSLASDLSQIVLEPYVGFRYTLNNVHLNTSIGNFSNYQNWVDPLLGLRATYDINQSWSAILAADGGGTGRTDYSYNLQGVVGYTPEHFKDLTVYAGYRFLSQYYTTGSGSSLFTWKMNIFGPMLGLAFTL